MAARSRARDDVDASRTQPRSDAYTGLLILAFVAQLAGALFFYFDYAQYPQAKPPKAPTPAPTPPPAVAPAVPGGGGPATQPGAAAPAAAPGAAPMGQPGSP